MAKVPKTAPAAKAGIPAGQRIPGPLAEAMRLAIARHAGCEVLFVCTLEAGQVASIHDAAHGNAGMVPIPRKQVESGMVIIHNHPSGRLIPSDADIRSASALADEGIGSWIVDNEVAQLYVIIDAGTDSPAEALDIPALEAMLAPGGSLSRGFPGYRMREGQVAMLRTVARAFNDNAIAAIEAGTGIGKSFAYLVPAVMWALRNRERVVVSTATINLQQQLVEKDLPLLARLLGQPVKAVLAKGRGNYVCLKRLAESLEEDSLLREEDSELSRLQEWVKVTPDGARSDLGFIPAEALWSRVNADADACPGMSCPKRDQCFFFRARREAAQANIVVANHHLVFADAAMRGQGLGFEATVVLPAFQRIIFDEAHNMEHSAVDFFALTMNRLMLAKYLNLLLRRRSGRAFGVLPLALQSVSIERIQVRGISVDAFDELIFALRDTMRRVDEEALAVMAGEYHLRLIPDMQDRVLPLIDRLAEFQDRLHALVQALDTVLEELDQDEPVREIPGLVDLGILVRRLGALAAAADTFRNYQAETDRVLWIQRERLDKGEAFAHFTACPLDIAPRLKEAIFQPYPTVVMTSATLTVGGDFGWWSRRLGLVVKEAAGPRGGGRPDQPGLDRAGAFAAGQPVRDEWSGYDSSWSDWESLETSQSGRPAALPAGGLDLLESAAPGPAFPAGPGAGAQPEVHVLAWLDREFLRIRLESPFDYRNRVLLAVPADAPDPQSAAYQPWLAQLVARVLTGAGGHALVLFTSYDMLTRTWDQVKPVLEAANIPAYRQGDMERSRLLKTFNTQLTSCLFATDSFWEGVDSPGDTLQVLVLCKLPFKVPTEPLQLARSEAIQARGGNPFMELSVPEAVMKFRQGFGRLMRRNEDFGLVVVPDRRLFAKHYGRIFLRSLPETATCQAPADQLLEEGLAFLGRLRREPGSP